MTTIENGLFSFKRSNDAYVLRNKAIVALNYVVKQLKCNNEQVVVLTGQLPVINNTVLIELSSDGKYIIELNDSIINFNHWTRHRGLVIKDVQKLLCDSCKGCKDDCGEGKKCIKNQRVFNTVMTYLGIIKSYSLGQPIPYNEEVAKFIQIAISNNHCYITTEYCNQLLASSISGNTQQNQDLFNYYIAIHYLAFYYYDKYNVNSNDIEGLKYVDSIWNYQVIKKCILNLGVCVGELEKLFEELVPDTSPVIENSPVVYNGFLYSKSGNDPDKLIISPIPIAYNLNDNTLTNFNKLIENYTNSLYSPASIIFLSLPTQGYLLYNEEEVVIGQEYFVNAIWVNSDNYKTLEGNILRYQPLNAEDVDIDVNVAFEYSIVDANGNSIDGIMQINLTTTQVYVYNPYNTEGSSVLSLINDQNNSIELGYLNGTDSILTEKFSEPLENNIMEVRLIKLSVLGKLYIKLASSQDYEEMLESTWYLFKDADELASIIFKANDVTENKIAVISYELRQFGDIKRVTRNNFIYINIITNELSFSSGHISVIPSEDITSIQDNRLIGKTSIDGYSVEGIMVQPSDIIFDNETGTIPNVTVYAGEKVIVFFTKDEEIND